MRCSIKYKIRRMTGSRVRSALRANKITKPSVCSMCGGCGNNGRIEGHHKDYRRVLDVTWLCPHCHGIVHSEIVHRRSSRQLAKIEAIKRREQQRIEMVDESWESNKIEPDPIDSIYDNMIFEEYRHQLSLEPAILGQNII